MQKFDDFKHQVNDLLHNEDKNERDQEDHEKEILDKEKEKMRSILRNEEKLASVNCCYIFKEFYIKDFPKKSTWR